MWPLGLILIGLLFALIGALIYLKEQREGAPQQPQPGPSIPPRPWSGTYALSMGLLVLTYLVLVWELAWPTRRYDQGLRAISLAVYGMALLGLAGGALAFALRARAGYWIVGVAAAGSAFYNGILLIVNGRWAVESLLAEPDAFRSLRWAALACVRALGPEAPLIPLLWAGPLLVVFRAGDLQPPAPKAPNEEPGPGEAPRPEG